MLIYHGSEKRIECPVLGLGNQRNDYGRGFYCTESLELAKELACQKKFWWLCKFLWAGFVGIEGSRFVCGKFQHTPLAYNFDAKSGVLA